MESDGRTDGLAQRHKHTESRVSATTKTRPDTRRDSRGRLGRDSNAKNACNSKHFGPTDGQTDQPTWQGVES